MADSLRGGIDLGGTKIQAVIVDSAHEVRGSARCPTPTSGGPPDVVKAMAQALEEAATQAGVRTADLSGAGAGSPGDIDPEAGTVARADNLPDWQEPFALAKELSQRIGSPVALGNDVSVATQAEFELGAGRPYSSLLGVFWGTGVGGGLILGGEPWHGRGSAGEIGHMVVKRDGALCPCGRRGCMEAYAGRRAMEERARELHDAGTKTDLFKIMKKGGRERLTSGVWERAADQGDKLALELLERAVQALGTGIASALNLLDVEAVVLGGGLGVRFGESWKDRLLAEIMLHLLRDGDPPGVHVAALGDLGGAIGASLLVS
jgi:glucokinase